jgi:hypothetical protein
MEEDAAAGDGDLWLAMSGFLLEEITSSSW